ncbi:MAG TPA: acetylornithine/succinylornithine family transaminase [Acidimicrobiia bacterium]|nr:acetylornithine/succinylornithine family transaminase [Acidimicrobiia bacterium]
MTNSFLLGTYPEAKATFVSGKGSYLFDSDGKEYLDFLGGIAVTALGHANDEISQIIATQSAKLTHVSNYFENEYTQIVAEKLNNKITADSGVKGKVFFANSGAEANECAIKIAKRFGNGSRYKFLTALGSFHGRTLATLAATGQSEKHKNFKPLPDYFDHFEFGNIESIKKLISAETIAVMIEVIQGENGVRIADQKFFDDLKVVVKENQLLLIVDEVQTGMCRTGKWFGFQHYGLNPDIVTMAKALGNGFPIGACWVKEDVASCMHAGDHGSTFGGQPLALASANGVIDIMTRDHLDLQSQKLGVYLIEQLASSGLFSEVRGKGLLVGADLDRKKISFNAHELVVKCFENGLVMNATGENTIRLAPALIISREEIDKAVSIVVQSVRV